MPVPLSSVVNVSISASPTPAALQGFGTLLFLATAAEAESVFSAGERVRVYTSVTEVTGDFAGTEVEAAATAYYSQAPKPSIFKVGSIYAADADISESLAAIEEYDDEFYGVIVDKSVRDTAVMSVVAAWVQARFKVFFATINDAAAKSLSTQSGTVAETLYNASYGRTLMVFGEDADQYPCASVAGRAFTVNFGGTNTTITLHMKKLPGITVSDVSSSEKAALENLNINAFINVAGNFLFSDGRQADGSWFDNIHGQDWLRNYIQTNVFNVLYLSTTKVPYTDAGVERIVDAVMFSLSQGVRNGLGAAGTDANGEFLASGYKVTTIPVADISTADRGNRLYNGIGFSFVGAGALQGITITGSFS